MSKKEFLVISIGIFLTIVAWIVIDIYHIRIKKYDESYKNYMVQPEFVIDKKIIDTLLKKSL